MAVGSVLNLATARGLSGVCGVYLLRHRESGRAYVGQSRDIGTRLARHRYDAKHPGRNRMARIIAALGIDAFDVQVVDTCDSERLDELEEFAIAFYDSANPATGFNGTTGGIAGNSYALHVRSRMAEAAARKASDPQWRATNAASIRAKYDTDPVYRRRMAEAAARRAPKYVWRHADHGTEVAGQSVLAEKYGLARSALSRVANGKQSHHKGWACCGAAEEPR